MRAVASTSGLRYVACTATQTSPDLPVCLRWLQEPSACTSLAQLLSSHLSRSSCTTAESDDQPCTCWRIVGPAIFALEACQRCTRCRLSRPCWLVITLAAGRPRDEKFLRVEAEAETVVIGR